MSEIDELLGDDLEDSKGTCELIIYCHECKSHFQLNPNMIALALCTNATIWEIYNYILTTKCRVCEEKQ